MDKALAHVAVKHQALEMLNAESSICLEPRFEDVWIVGINNLMQMRARTIRTELRCEGSSILREAF
jgi:hypothetical protein